MAKKKQTFLSAVISAVALFIIAYIVAATAGDYIASIGKTFKPSFSTATKASPTR